VTGCRPHESKLERSLQIPRGGIFRQRWDTVLPLPHQHIRTSARHAFRSGPTNEWSALGRSLRFLSAMFLRWLRPQVTPLETTAPRRSTVATLPRRRVAKDRHHCEREIRREELRQRGRVEA
jgi:hypothetical protein